MDAFASGYEASTKVGEDVAASSALKKAYEQAPEDPTTGTKDMFKVNTLAAQMTAARGNTRAAEKFEKQAEQSQKSALENQLNQFKVADAKFEQFEKSVQMIDSADSGVNEVLKSNMPEDQKMKFVNMFKQTQRPDGTTDESKLSALKDKIQNATMDAKDRMSAAQKVLKMQLDAELKREGLDLKRQLLSMQAGNQNAAREDRKDWHEYQKEKDKEDRALKQEIADNNLIANFDKLEINANKIKDPEARKSALKKLNMRRQQAEDRIAGRDIDDTKPDSKGRTMAKPGGSQKEKIQAALGDKYDPNKKYRVDSQGNIYEE